MKILHLTLKKKYFDLIASGQKTVEYREYKSYWIPRLYGKVFDEVHFRNGYRKSDPFMRVANPYIRVIQSRHHKPINGEDLTADRYFAIYLGGVLEVRRHDE